MLHDSRRVRETSWRRELWSHPWKGILARGNLVGKDLEAKTCRNWWDLSLGYVKAS